MKRLRQPATRDLAIGKNSERTRLHNRRVVLEAVRLHGPIGRAEIARLTHLTAQAVSNIVAELESEGLLLQRGRRRTARGQPPKELIVNPEGSMTAGVEVGADRMVSVLVDLAGKIRASRTIPLSLTAPDHVTPLIAVEIDELRRAVPSAPDRLMGVGVVMPGPFEIEGMSSVGPTTLPGWQGLDVAAVLSDATGETVSVENDATAAAVGERLHGVARELRHFCLVYFGAGLGLGVVSDGRPFRGAFGNAGEIGHVVVDPGGRPCPCGNRGCLERYASVHALREELAQKGIRCEGVGDIERLAAANHPVLRAWIAETARRLGPVIAMIENMFDPESVILGGAVPDGVMDAIIRAMEPLPRSVASRRERSVPRVMRGTTGGLTAALGAAALPLLETVTPRLDTAASLRRPDEDRHAHAQRP